MENIKVKFGNRILIVPAEDKDKYIRQEYTVYGMDGNLIYEPEELTREEFEALKRKLEDTGQRLRDAEQELQVAKERNADLSGKLKAAHIEIDGLTRNIKTLMGIEGKGRKKHR